MPRHEKSKIFSKSSNNTIQHILQLLTFGSKTYFKAILHNIPSNKYNKNIAQSKKKTNPTNKTKLKALTH